MNEAKPRLIDLIADRVDLAIDFLTLGQYGLEHLEAADAAGGGAFACDTGCEGGGPRRYGGGRREALPPARTRGCARPGSHAARSA